MNTVTPATDTTTPGGGPASSVVPVSAATTITFAATSAMAHPPGTLSPLVADSRGLRGVLLRFTANRFVSPEDGLRTTVPLPAWERRREDHIAALFFLLWPLFSPLLVSVLPIDSDGTERMPPAAAATHGFIVALATVPYTGFSGLAEATTGGMHPEGLRRPLTTLLTPAVLWGVSIFLWLWAVGPFPMLHLVTTLLLVVFYIPAIKRAPSFARINVAMDRVGNAASLTGGGIVLFVGAYFLALSRTDNSLERILIGLAFDVVISMSKWRLRLQLARYFPISAAVVIADMYGEGLATLPQLLTFALSDSVTVVTLLLAQVGGVLWPFFWHFLRHKAMSQRRREEAAMRVAVTCFLHVYCAFVTIVWIALARRGPNAADLSQGQVTAEQEAFVVPMMLLWAGTFVVEGVVVGLWVRRHWGIDVLAEFVRAVYDFTPCVTLPLVGVPSAMAFIGVKQMQMLWLAFPENGLDH